MFISTKSSVFSTISLAAFLVLLLLAIQSIVLDKKRLTQLFPVVEVYTRIQLNSFLAVQEIVEDSYVEHLGLSCPPINVTEAERISWFRQQLPYIEIFKSNEVTRKFGMRAQMFLERGCEVQFFMTWISPASSFHQRELLSVESVFNAHPSGCLMILSQTMDSELGNQILKPLIDNGFRVVALAPDLPFLFKDTPAEAWFDEIKKGNKDPGEIPLAQNLSNLLRLAVLYKYGGVYIDADFIVLKKLSHLKNAIGAQSMDVESLNWTRLNNAVLIFEKNHPLVFKFIEEFSLTFNGNKWGHNGPYLVSRVVEKVQNQTGYSFTVLPQLAFYPVYWSKLEGFFQKPKTVAGANWAAKKLLQLRRETYGVHLWNKQSSRLRIEEGSIIGKLVSQNCVLCQHIYYSS